MFFADVIVPNWITRILSYMHYMIKRQSTEENQWKPEEMEDFIAKRMLIHT